MPVFNFNFPLTIRDNRWLLGPIVVVVATRSWTIYLNKWITIRLTTWSCKTNKSVAKPTRMWRQKFGGECDASFDNAFHKACSSQENLKPRRQRRGCSRPVAELKNGQSPLPGRCRRRRERRPEDVVAGGGWVGDAERVDQDHQRQARRVDSLLQLHHPAADGLWPKRVIIIFDSGNVVVKTPVVG